MPRPSNMLFIMSDQHSRDMSACYGNPLVQTPNIDALAERGTRFSNAVTNCPICVPARASLATGRYVHEIGYWDNAFPYDGQVRGWGHSLIDEGIQVDSIGKLHYRSPDDAQGFSNEIDGLYVVEGIGDVEGCIRGDARFRKKRGGILESGPGNSTYLDYDRRNATNACRWLAEHRDDERPWVLFLSFVCPHPPYIAPAEWFTRYPLDEIPLPPQWRSEDWPQHPVMAYFRDFFDFAEPFTEEQVRQMNSAYYGVTSFLDERIGEVLHALSETGLDSSTRVMYSSDHGECRGARGIFGKFTMYEESVGVPMIVAGPDVPAGHVNDTPVSLIDAGPTILDAIGAARESTLPGESLLSLANTSEDRMVFSEYHAVGSRSGYYMLRNRKHKYVHYVDGPPQLFDLELEPDEVHDLADEPESGPMVDRFRQELNEMLDPVAVDLKAKADQLGRVASFGGRGAVLARGAFDNSPVPGEMPEFKSESDG